MRNLSWCMLSAFLGMSLVPAEMHARTITLTAEDCDMMAVLWSEAPRLSWAPVRSAEDTFDTTAQLQFRPGMAVLMRFPLHQIPKNQRILKAELTLTNSYFSGNEAQMQLRRVLADWGPGVCHDFRRTYPKKEPWAQPGGLGAGTDRANKDTALFVIKSVGDHTVDVTEDIDLWYTGGAVNRGWVFHNGNGHSWYGPAPYSGTSTSKSWKLVITFEDK